jgi:hypothetical protein
MSPVTARWNPPDAIGIVAGNLSGARSWMPKAISRAAHQLGQAGVDVMRDATDVNRYTGSLGESISAEYGSDDTVVTISPKVMRGIHDGGLILEFGTRPIPRAPWAPIAAWASFRGAPMPGAWLKIRSSGVSPHPFLDRTLQYMDGEIAPILEELLRDVTDTYLFAGFP